MEVEEEYPVEGFTTPPRGQRPSSLAADTATPVSDRSLKTWRSRQSSRDGLFETHDSPMSPGSLANKGSGWEGCTRSSALLKNGSRGRVETVVSGKQATQASGDGVVVLAGHRAAVEGDKRRDGDSDGGSWQWMNSTTQIISSRQSNVKNNVSARTEGAVVQAEGTRERNEGKREASKQQEREFTSPVAGDELTDSSSDHNGPITNWFPVLPWPRHPFRSHRRKDKGGGGGNKGADRKIDTGESRHGAEASTLAGSPPSVAFTAARQHTIAGKSPLPDASATTATRTVVAGQVVPKSSQAKSGGGPKNEPASLVASRQCQRKEASVASPAKNSHCSSRTLSEMSTAARSAVDNRVGSTVSEAVVSLTPQSPLSSKRVAKGRGTRPSSLRPESGASAVDSNRNGNCYPAASVHNTESRVKQFPGMRLKITGPGEQDGGRSEYRDSGDSAAASNNPESSTTGFDLGFDAPMDAEDAKGSTTLEKASTEGVIASDGRQLYSVGAGRDSIIITRDQAEAPSRRKMRNDDNWWRKPSEKEGQTTATENRLPSSSISVSTIAKSGVSQPCRDNPKMAVKGATAVVAASPAQSTISSREQAERDRERLAGWGPNGRRRSHRTSWSVTVDHTTPLDGYGTGTEIGSGSWNWYHKEGSSSGWGLTTDDEGRTAASSAGSKRNSSSATPGGVAAAASTTASSALSSRREATPIEGLSYSAPGGDSRRRTRQSVIPSSSSWAERAGVTHTPPPSHFSDKFASSGSGPRLFPNSGGTIGGGDGGRSSRSSSMSTGYESSVVEIPPMEEVMVATATNKTRGSSSGENYVTGDAYEGVSRSGECPPPSPSRDDFDIVGSGEYYEEKNNDRHLPKARSPTTEGVLSVSPPPPPSPSPLPQPAVPTPLSGYYPPPSPAGSMPDMSPEKPGHGTERTALEALAQLKREHYEAMRKKSNQYRDQKSSADIMARGEGRTTDEDKSVSSPHLPGAMRPQSCERGETHQGYRRGKSCPDYIQDSTGSNVPAEDQKGSRPLAVTASKGGALHQRVSYLQSSVSEGTPLTKAPKLRRQQHATAEEAARAAVAWTPFLANQQVHKQPRREPDFKIGMSPAGIAHRYEQRKLEQASLGRTRQLLSQTVSEGANSRSGSRPSSLRQREQAAAKKRNSPLILSTGIDNAANRERRPLVIPPLPKVLFPQTKPAPSSQDRAGAGAAIPSPFIATRETVKPRKAKKDASRARAHRRPKKVRHGKPIGDEVLTVNTVKNDEGGDSKKNIEIQENAKVKADITGAVIAPAQGKDLEDTSQGNKVYRTKSLRVGRAQLAAASVSSGQGGEQRSVSLSAIPPKGNESHQHLRQQEGSGKGSVARVCSVLSVSWLWRKNRSSGGNHRRGGRQGREVKGGLANVRSGAFPTEGFVGRSSDSEDDRSSSFIRGDRGDARVEAIKAPGAIHTTAATRSRSSKFKRVISFGRLGFKGGEQSEMTSFSFVHHDNRAAGGRATGGGFVAKDEDKGSMAGKQLGGGSAGDGPAQTATDKTIRRLNRQQKSSSEMLTGGYGWLEASDSGGVGSGDGVGSSHTTARKRATSNGNYGDEEKEDLRWINFNGVDGRGGGVVAVPRGATVAAVKTDGGVSGR